MTTIRDLLAQARAEFADSDTPSLDAQVLLGAVLNVDRAYLLAHGEDDLSPENEAQFRQMIARRSSGEPIAYILGTRAFYDLELIVTPDVLIPRPETELLLETALKLTKHQQDITVADIGTGSGALAVTFARHHPSATVYAVDVSPSALDVARKNAERNQAEVCFFEGNLAQPLIERGIKLNLLMANLPYIATDVMAGLDVSRYEPHLALDGGADGLDLIRDLLDQVPEVCADDCPVLLEIGYDQGHALQKLVYDKLGIPCEILQDYAGLDRIGKFIFHKK